MGGTFPTALREAQERAHLTGAEAATLCGVSVPAWRKWLAGTRRPSPESLARIARVLDADHDRLARLCGYAPLPLDGEVVRAQSAEQAAWLRLLAARFDADELERLYAFAVEWLPGVMLDATEPERPAVRRRA